MRGTRIFASFRGNGIRVYEFYPADTPFCIELGVNELISPATSWVKRPSMNYLAPSSQSGRGRVSRFPSANRAYALRHPR
ncbi:MAG: hypothetical protein P8M78_00205 [Myxococcota bacterium]|nr:hypothetical protein [Myxococcota bacterium]